MSKSRTRESVRSIELPCGECYPSWGTVQGGSAEPALATNQSTHLARIRFALDQPAIRLLVCHRRPAHEAVTSSSARTSDTWEESPKQPGRGVAVCGERTDRNPMSPPHCAPRQQRRVPAKRTAPRARSLIISGKDGPLHSCRNIQRVTSGPLPASRGVSTEIVPPCGAVPIMLAQVPSAGRSTIEIAGCV